MSTFDTTRWYRHKWAGDYRPLVSEPDSAGHLPVVLRDGRYVAVQAEYLTLIPERHTVEWRKPKTGERAISCFGEIIVALNDYAVERWVIVDDEKETS